MNRNILPGILDASFSSLAAFMVGLCAVYYLQPAELGAYALAYSAFLLVTKIPSQLLFTPAEVFAVSLADDAKLKLLFRSLRVGLLPTLLSALIVLPWVLVAPASIPSAVIVALTAGVVASSLVSPLQDHTRRMLHIAGESWIAAGVSITQFFSVIISIGIMSLGGASADWIPFGALAIANTCSLSVGLLMAWQRAPGPIPLPMTSFRQLVESGRWLLLVGVLPMAVGFIVAALVSRLAGPQALGFAEAARLLAQPPVVLAMGLSAVLGPRSMKAAQIRDRRAARQISTGFSMILLGVSVPYLILVGVSWDWSPLPALLPSAYAVAGLIAVSLVANVAISSEWPFRAELIGGGRHVTVAQIEVVGGFLRVAIGGMAGLLGAFTLPLSLLAQGFTRSIGYRIVLRAFYRQPAEHKGLPGPALDYDLAVTGGRPSRTVPPAAGMHLTP